MADDCKAGTHEHSARLTEDDPGTRPELPPGQHELMMLAFVGSIFGLLMILQERFVLEMVARGAPIPSLLWRLQWPLLLVLLSILLPVRARIVFLSVAGFLLGLVALGDAAYFRFFGSVTSLVSAGTMHQLYDVRDSVLDVVKGRDLVVPGLLLALSAFALLPLRWLVGPSERALDGAARRLLVVRLGTLLMLFSTIAWATPIYEDTHHIGRDKWVLPEDHWGSRYSYSAFALTFGLYNYHAHDLVEFLDLGIEAGALSEERVVEIDAVVDRKRALNRIPTPLEGIAAGRRVVVIQLEAIVHWLLDFEHDGTQAMPFLSQLAAHGLSWDYVMDVTSIGRTSDAEFAVMTGLLPDTSRPNSFAHPDRARSYLPRVLGDLGYATASYHGYKMTFWNRTYTHPTYGFEESFFDEAYDADRILGLGVPDEVVYDFVADRIAAEAGPSLSFVISLTSHHPFTYTPREYNELFPDLTLEDGWGLLGPYLRSARYTDDALAAFFADLGERGVLEDTLFVIYGDHDSGTLHTLKTLPQMSPYSYTVAEERVPFVIAIPGRERDLALHGEDHTDATGGLHDTFPTIMHLLGEPVPEGVLGTNLLVPDQRRDPVPLLSRLGDLLYAYRHCIHTSRGSACIDEEAKVDRPGTGASPTLVEGVRDQIIVRELLDHPEYWDRERPAPALASAEKQ